MTTQREQLELAAIALGYSIGSDMNGCPVRIEWRGDYHSIAVPWNPIDSNDDCAAMRARLRIDTAWLRDYVLCGAHPVPISRVEYSDHNNDPEAAERAASVAVAAEIGRRMKA